MSDRTLDSVQAAEAIRRPSFEMQQAALAAGFGSVRDWALAQCVDEIRALKERVKALEKGEMPRFRVSRDEAGELNVNVVGDDAARQG